MHSIRSAIVAAFVLAAMPASAKQPFEGTWAEKAGYCGVDTSKTDDFSQYPLVITEERVDWALNRCQVLKRTGKSGAWQVFARCEGEGEIDNDQFQLRVKGDRLTVVVNDGTRASYVRCKQTAKQ